MRIRPASTGDAARFTELARAAKGSWNYPAEWLAGWTDQLKVTPEYLAEHDALAAVIDDVVVGCAALEDHGDFFMIEHVWIDPAHQGRGIGRLLIERLLEMARGRTNEVHLMADPHAEEFYARLGAKKTADVPAPMPGAPSRTLPVMVFEV